MAKAKKGEEQKPIEQAPVVEEKKPVKSLNGLKRVKVNEAELSRLQSEGLLVGYDPETQEAIVNE